MHKKSFKTARIRPVYDAYAVPFWHSHSTDLPFPFFQSSMHGIFVVGRIKPLAFQAVPANSTQGNQNASISVTAAKANQSGN